MKQFKLLTAAIVLTAAFSSCKKETTANNNQAGTPRIVKVDINNGANIMNITYNAEGRMVESKDLSFTQKFTYPGGGYFVDVFNSTNVKSYVYDSKVLSNGRVTNMDYQFYNNGVFSFSETNTFQYDANGYLVAQAYGNNGSTFEITNGNITKRTRITNGVVQGSFVAEFYTDKPNKMNINWIENNFFDMFLTDKDQCGKSSVNLVKKITYTSISGTTYAYAFTYDLDANGYVKSYTVTETGSSPGSYTVKFTYA